MTGRQLPDGWLGQRVPGAIRSRGGDRRRVLEKQSSAARGVSTIWLVAGSNWAVDATGAPPLGVSVTIAHLTVVSLSGSETPVRITGE